MEKNYFQGLKTELLCKRQERFIVSYRTVFSRCARHLRIPVPEELTEAVLIHAAANGSRPLPPLPLP